MRNAVILGAMVLMMATGANGQTPAVELKVGDEAPDFSLPASDGKTYKLSDFKGKKAVVVAWFPKAYTSGCTIECKSLAENGDKIRKFNVAYFMASVDSIEDNKGFAEKEKADFPLLSDPTKATAKAYGVLPRAGYRAAMDVLYRQGREDPGHRQGGPPGRPRPKTWSPSSASSASNRPSRTGSSQGEFAFGAPSCFNSVARA